VIARQNLVLVGLCQLNKKKHHIYIYIIYANCDLVFIITDDICLTLPSSRHTLTPSFVSFHEIIEPCKGYIKNYTKYSLKFEAVVIVE